jgi:hypothetical protein
MSSRENYLNFLKSIDKPIVDYVPGGGFGGGHGPRDITYILSKDGLYYFYYEYFEGPFVLTKEGKEQAEKIIRDGREQEIIDDTVADPEESLEELMLNYEGKTIIAMIKAGCESEKNYYLYPVENAGIGKYYENIESVNEAFIADILANYDKIDWEPWDDFDTEGLQIWCNNLIEIRSRDEKNF